MAVSFDPRASSVSRANVQTNAIARPTPLGLVSAPSVLETSPSASSSEGCCGWIAKICEWIRSLFSVNATTFPPTHEGMVAKGKNMIDEVLKNPPPFNPAITGLVCVMRFNDVCKLHFCRASTGGDTFKENCYRQWESLLNQEDLRHVASGTVAIKMMYFVKNNPIVYNFTHRALSTHFPGSDRDAEEFGGARSITWDRVVSQVQEISDQECRYALFVFFRTGL